MYYTFTLVLWAWACFSQVYSRSVALGFKPSEIVTRDLHGGCAHLHRDHKSYQLRKFNIIKKEKKEETDDAADRDATTTTTTTTTIFPAKVHSFFSSLSKFMWGSLDESETSSDPILFGSLKNFTALDSPFQVDYQCQEGKENYCDRIKTSFEKVPAYFTRALDIYTPISIRLNVFSFSASEHRNTSDALAITTPPPYLVLKDSENGWPFSYPFTLIKQLNTDVELQYAEEEAEKDQEDGIFDIEIDINTDQMGEYQYFAGMLAHEILHGLGIYYLIQPLASMMPEGVNLHPEVVVPPLDIVEYEGEEEVLWEMNTFLPPSIYERNFVDLDKILQNNGSVAFTPDYYFFNESYYNAFQDLPLGFTFHQPFQSDKEAQRLQLLNETITQWSGYPQAQEFYRAGATANRVGFLTEEGDLLPLQTYNDDYTGDLFHISTPYPCESKSTCRWEDEHDHHTLDFGPNFVMLTKYYLMDLTVEEKINLIAPNNTYGLLGDGLVHMLSTLGWTEKGHSPNAKLYYVVLEEELPGLQMAQPVNPTYEPLKLYRDQLNIGAIVSASTPRLATSNILALLLWHGLILFLYHH